jgi:PAS domain-containing protein
MAATMTLATDGRVLEASPDALDLLDIDLDELRSLPPGSFSPDPPDPEAEAAFRDEWEAQGRPDVMGEGTLQRLDGSKVRVRFAITPTEDGRFRAVFEPVDTPVGAPPRSFTAGEVLAAWRTAERRLMHLAEGSAEWAAATLEIEHFRAEYQAIFDRGGRGSGATS